MALSSTGPVVTLSGHLTRKSIRDETLQFFSILSCDNFILLAAKKIGKPQVEISAFL
jgi:hypothetical protein